MSEYKDKIAAIFEAKKKHGRVFYLDTAGGIVYRPLTESEFTAVASLAKKFPPAILNEILVEKTVVFTACSMDWLMNDSPAGLVDNIAEAIVNSSKFKTQPDLEKELEKAKKHIDYSLSDSVHAITANIFPDIQVSDLKDMTYDELVLLLAKAQLLSNPPGKSPAKPRDDLMSPKVADRLV